MYINLYTTTTKAVILLGHWREDNCRNVRKWSERQSTIDCIIWKTDKLRSSSSSSSSFSGHAGSHSIAHRSAFRKPTTFSGLLYCCKLRSGGRLRSPTAAWASSCFLVGLRLAAAERPDAEWAGGRHDRCFGWFGTVSIGLEARLVRSYTPTLFPRYFVLF